MQQNLINSSNQDLPGLNKQALVYIITTFFNEDGLPVEIINSIGTQFNDKAIVTWINDVDNTINVTRKPYKITIYWPGINDTTKVILDFKDTKKAYIPALPITGDTTNRHSRLVLILNNSDDPNKLFPKLSNYPVLNFDPDQSVSEPIGPGSIICGTLKGGIRAISNIPIRAMFGSKFDYPEVIIGSDVSYEITTWEGAPLISPINPVQQNYITYLVSRCLIYDEVNDANLWLATYLGTYKDFILNNLHNPPIVTFNKYTVVHITLNYIFNEEGGNPSIISLDCIGVQISDTTILSIKPFNADIPPDILPAAINMRWVSLLEDTRSLSQSLENIGDYYFLAPDINGIDSKSQLFVIRIPTNSQQLAPIPQLEDYPNLNFENTTYSANDKGELIYLGIEKYGMVLKTIGLQYDYTDLYNIVLTSDESLMPKPLFVGGPIIIPINSDKAINTVTALISNKESLNSDTIWHGILLAPFKEFILNHI